MEGAAAGSGEGKDEGSSEEEWGRELEEELEEEDLMHRQMEGEDMIGDVSSDDEEQQLKSAQSIRALLDSLRGK